MYVDQSVPLTSYGVTYQTPVKNLTFSLKNICMDNILSKRPFIKLSVLPIFSGLSFPAFVHIIHVYEI